MTVLHPPEKVAPLLLAGLFLTGTLAASHAEMLAPPPRAHPVTVRPSAEKSGQTRTGAYSPEALNKLPLYFVENRGQLDPQAAYYVPGRETSLYFTSTGITLALQTPAQSDGAPSKPGARYALKLDFVGANPEVQPAGQERTPAMVSYFKGPRQQWKTGLKTYGEVVYRNLWPGIDLVYSGTVSQLKYEFRVHPGADPDQIRLAYRGAKDLKVNTAGELEVSTPGGGFKDAQPYTYQERNGRRVKVPSAYDVSGHSHAYGFRVGKYDRSWPLVIDPAVLVYASFLGGSGQDGGGHIAVDSAGNVYITGGVNSTELTFPVTVGPDLTFNGVPVSDVSVDAFVAKFNADGTALFYAGYIGGSDFDAAPGIAVDEDGNAYIAGFTSSTEATFPVTRGPDLTHNGSSDAFVARVNATGTALDYAGYIGGAGADAGTGIAVDRFGNVYVVGGTQSTETTFPTTAGPDLSFNGITDAFVAKVAADGTGLVYAGYIGGARDDAGFGIAVDHAGRAYVVGSTTSRQSTFPVAVGPDRTFNEPFNAVGGRDAFVARVNSAGTALDYAGYIGGAGLDEASDVEVDAHGNAYVVGGTASRQNTFPDGNGFGRLPGSDHTYNGGVFDAFVAKVNPSGTALLYASYLGGNADDSAASLAVDSEGNVYLTGYTSSTETTFPAVTGPDRTYNGGTGDAFVAKVNAAGSLLVYAGFLGGAGEDAGSGIAMDGSGNAYVSGHTASTEATFPDGDGFGSLPGLDQTFNGITDAFVVKIREVEGVSGGILSVPGQLSFRVRAGRTGEKKLVIRNRSRNEDLTVTIQDLAAPFEVVSGGGLHVLAPGGRHTAVIAFSPEGRGYMKANLVIESSDPNRPLVCVKLAGFGRKRHP